MRHRTRWYAVARRMGHEDPRHWCASRADALGIAEDMWVAHRAMAEYEHFKAIYDAAPEWKRVVVDAYLESLRGQE
ncbi:hypothetical protein [Altererythrobacter sp. Root672]|uniref:hypothetical protein n=1 Tax=Altererythrobacter sp. Root672 TaxID=1736584 RepID=UPI0012E37BF0|nr:hypothetical protein [Altererythrobacter sp. Root672]